MRSSASNSDCLEDVVDTTDLPYYDVVRYLAFLSADLLMLAAVTYESESTFNPNPFNRLLGRHEPHSYWGICNVMAGFRELLKYSLRADSPNVMYTMLSDAFVEIYGSSYDPLAAVGASQDNWPLQYAPRARECRRIANFLLNKYR